MSDDGTTDGGPAPRRAKVPGREPLRAPLPKRFYKVVTVGSDPGLRILLDGRPIKTPRKRPLTLPAHALAEAIAAEWAAQREVIDPATMPLTKIANSAIDAVADARDGVEDDIAAFAGCDVLCYRAEAPPELAQRQTAAWNPIVAWGEDAIGSWIRLAVGVTPIEQPGSVREGVLRVLAPACPFRLAALHVITTLTGSALLALAHGAGHLDCEETWSAAHIDEDWQIEQWGEDAEAAARRAFRHTEFMAASRMLTLLQD